MNPQPKVFLVILDGLRWDLYGEPMSAMETMAQNGVHAEWLDPIFPTMSTPSMYSIASGNTLPLHRYCSKIPEIGINLALFFLHSVKTGRLLSFRLFAEWIIYKCVP